MSESESSIIESEFKSSGSIYSSPVSGRDSQAELPFYIVISSMEMLQSRAPDVWKNVDPPVSIVKYEPKRLCRAVLLDRAP